MADAVDVAARARQVSTAPATFDGDPVARLVAAAEHADTLRRAALRNMDQQDWAAVSDGIGGISDFAPIPDGDLVRFDDDAMAQIQGGLASLDIDQALLLDAAATLAIAIDDVIDAHDAGVVFSSNAYESPLGEIVIDDGSGVCDTVYSRSIFLVIDQCGNDLYLAPAGGADGLGATPLAITIDLDGDDRAYEETVRPSVGSAVFGGISIFVDTAGNDRWGRGLGAQLGGTGLAGGLGIMVDTEGDDVWSAMGFLAPGGKFGAGHFAGTGVLVDENGNDTYSGDTFQQGSGWFGDSLGVLVDRAGDDRYFDISTYAQGSGGVGGTGFLLDESGNDFYDARNVFEQGGAACGGVGVLLDLVGDDVYYEIAALSQGAAATGLAATGCGDEAGTGIFHRAAALLPPEISGLVPTYTLDEALRNLPLGAVGILADGGGSDQYIGGTAGQAFHAGNAAGLLLDADGDDEYQGGDCVQAFGAGISSSCYGLSGSPGMSLLVDGGGHDRYLANDPNTSQGAGHGGSIAVLWDVAGTDTYSSGDHDGGGFQQRGENGLLVDLLPPPSDGDGYELPAPPDSLPFGLGSSGGIGFDSDIAQLCTVDQSLTTCSTQWRFDHGVLRWAERFDPVAFEYHWVGGDAVSLDISNDARLATTTVEFLDSCVVEYAHIATTGGSSGNLSHGVGRASGQACGAPILAWASAAWTMRN